MVTLNPYLLRHEIPAGGEAGQLLTKTTDEDYDIKWGQPYEFNPKLIWENSNPGSGFGAQTLTFDENYNFFLW